eukprot:CAMPEP_0170636750 /NCGR_PEP_ID=MMETSP0224-20130122/38007_1 /TAXON_ID=285029 /ORGANISM="Togula jolla, Strain CCCM 725" /LENGTH=55 /DNA_ID=CAMNT_0010966509 /DNA_START=122 /DNA_END=286 /DNA_ORIENTATION=+
MTSTPHEQGMCREWLQGQSSEIYPDCASQEFQRSAVRDRSMWGRPALFFRTLIPE